MTHTNSSLGTYRECPQKYDISYNRLLRPMRAAPAQAIGNAWHEVRETYLKSGFEVAAEKLTGIFFDPGAHGLPEDSFLHTKLQAMLVGYHARWHQWLAGIELVDVERQWAWEDYAGKFDAIVRDAEGLWVVEEKTSGETINESSVYWSRLEVDTQTALYYRAAEHVYGERPQGIIYMVTCKPKQEPLLATPNPKFKKCRKCKDGQDCDHAPEPYANTRLTDETPTDYMCRILDAMAEDPAAYFHMQKLFKTENDIKELLKDLDMAAEDITISSITHRWPRNRKSCFGKYGTCAYLSMCAGRGTEFDFRKVDRPHQELEP